jgi:NADPH2 dehydrogenase
MKTFESITINNMTLKNRIVMAPMCMYEADNLGFVQPFHLVHYPTRAYGGVGLIITEATAVESRGRISSRDLGIWDDKHITGLTSLVESVHRAGAKIGIQLAHVGRKCNAFNEPLISPSAVLFNSDYTPPKEMSILDIKTVIDAFRNGAKRAKLIGYDLIEIHGAHGYLINQFLSPLTNYRDDEYGGSAENRRRFLNEIIDAIREVWEGPLCLRLSAEEYAEGGNHIEDTLNLIDTLKQQVDLLNISSGGVVPVKFDVYPGYQMELAKKIRQKGYLVLGGGLLTNPSEVEKYLNNESADLIFLGRILLKNPYFVLQAADEANRKDLIIKPYERGF